MDKKYELTNETITINKTKVLHRIRAIKDFGNVKSGDLGGYIESEDNLSHKGNCWIYDKSEVYDNAQVYEDALVHGTSIITGNARVCGNAYVVGRVFISENAIIRGNAHVFHNSEITGNSNIKGNSYVYNNAKIYGSVTIYDDAMVCNDAQIYGNSIIYGKAIISNKAKVHGNSEVSGYSEIYNEAVIHDSHISGKVEVYGDAKINCVSINQCEKIGWNGYIDSYKKYIAIGPIGSRYEYTTFYLTIEGDIWVSCGCFNGNIDDFEKEVKEVHNSDIFEKEYLSTIKFVKQYFKKMNKRK